MKARYILSVIVGAIFTSILMGACGEDRWAGYAEQTKTDRWIYDTMQVHYYWQDAIISYDEANFFTEPFKFFKSLLSKEDGKNGNPYSTIDSLHTSNTTRSIAYTEYSYGFDFALYQLEGSKYAALILYVADNSPADEIGLKRGDWIIDMNGEAITRNNYSILFGSNQLDVTIGYYDAEQNAIVALEEKLTLPAARAIEDNPVYYKNTYEVAGKQVGYLVYNHFTAGPTENSNEYDNDLRAASNYFASKQVDEFILDLRYNNGGALGCAQLLCNILAPASALNQTMGYIEYNENYNPREHSFSFNQEMLKEGNNLNLKRLYVLTTNSTASSSEIIINCLRPYMEVIVVGDQTEGKNVGSLSYKNEELQLIMRPIVCKVYNANHESNYSNGFKADVTIKESSDLARFLPFGDTNELLLGTALELIEGGDIEEAPETRSSNKFQLVENSLQRRATGSVWID